MKRRLSLRPINTDRGGYYELDAYNQQVIVNGISYAITTRTFGDNNHFLLEVTESADSASD